MAYCRICGHQLRDVAKYCPECGQPVSSTSQPIKPKNHMAMAIATTVLFCMPIGFIAINHANKVDSYYYAGMYEAAEKASRNAKKWSVIGMVITGFILVIYIIVFAMLITAF